jgi:hypothetical protein
MSDTPKCEKCGLEITTGMMPALCNYARQCVMWPHSDGTPEGDGAELLMAKWWMDTACEQIGLQIAERERLERELADRKVDIDRLVKVGAELSASISDSRQAICEWTP